MLRKLGAVKGVAAHVAFRQRGTLLGRAVLLLDVAKHGAVLVELDAPVAKGIRHGHGEDGGGMRAVGNAFGKRADSLRLDERQVAVEHHDRSRADARGLENGANRVAGAQAFGLLNALYARVGALAVGAVQQGAHLVGVAANYHHHAVNTCGNDGVGDPENHRLAQNLVRDLGVVGLHAGTFTRCKDDGRRRDVRIHGPPRLVCLRLLAHGAGATRHLGARRVARMASQGCS